MEVPAVPRFSLPGQPGQLSLERLNFGDVAAHGVLRRVVFLRNPSATDELAFRWDCGEFGKVLEVRPASGRVAPGASCMCHVVFHACDGARVYDFDAVCHLRNHT